MSLKRKSPETEVLLAENPLPKLLKLNASHIDSKCYITSKMRIPPSQIPALSKSTYEIIEDLKKSQQPSPFPPNKSILNTIPASEKFKHLLGSDKSLPLPAEYQNLIKLFRVLDSTVFYARFRKNSMIFNNIQKAVEETHHLNCKILQVQQILSVFPEAYDLTWNLIQKEYFLFIDFIGKVEKDDIPIRKKRFDEKMIEIVKEKHKEFLKINSFEWELTEKWHPLFDLSSLPSISAVELPPKPEITAPQLDTFINKHFLNNSLNDSPEYEIVETSETSQIKGLCPSIAAKIIAKEKHIQRKKSSLIDTDIVKEHSKGERLIRMTEILKVLYSTHKSPSMFWDILVDKLRHLLACYNKRIVEEDLYQVINDFPDFASLIQTSSGPVVRINRQNDFKLGDLRNEINKKYNLT